MPETEVVYVKSIAGNINSGLRIGTVLETIGLVCS